MSVNRSRREFLRQSAATGFGFWVASRLAWAEAKSPNERLNIGVIGVSGQGEHDTNQIVHENIVALCDVDERRSGKAREAFPQAKFYTDFRKLLDQKDIDAVLIATPDHTHAVATMAAFKAGKHVYCEKPLTHSVYEAQVLLDAARKAGKVTQMGTQIHGHSNYRRVVELIQSKAIGEVQHVHVWVGRQWAGGERPKDTPSVPEGLHYDLWLGPAPYRPYNPAYLPGNWRGWWDFGGGTLGDMGCHYMDLPYWALDLSLPATIEAKGPELSADSTPPRLMVDYEHLAKGNRPGLKLTWYHGGERPLQFAEKTVPEWPGDGVLFVGSKGMLITDYDNHKLLPEKDFADYKPPKPYIPESIGHYKEWTEACKGNGKTLCRFEYAVPLTQSVLLGNVAYRCGKKIEWDAEHLKAKNAPEADAFIRRPYREGWSL